MSSERGRPTHRVLIVAPEPDERLSTAWLVKISETLAARDATTSELWFLRDFWKRRPQGARNVDGLRTWWLNRVLMLARMDRVAAFARGRRVRRWFRALDPNVVVLDDGYGARLLPYVTGKPVIVVRRNAERGNDHGFETEPLDTGDLTITHQPTVQVQGAEVALLPPPIFGDLPATLRFGRRVRQRGRSGLPAPAGAVVVCGWGQDGWVDGSDLFVRTLWFLEHHHGMVAHGVWFSPLDDDVEIDRIRVEADLCGLAERLHLVADDPELRWKGDAVLLPRRVALDTTTVTLAGATQVPLVTFAPSEHAAPWLTAVPFLDLSAAAGAVAHALRSDPTDRERWFGELGWHQLADELLRLVDERSRSET